ncbi:transketolase [Brachyspira pilosicoli]|uniref:transketolase n=1 Tax=Brachyspira pilosicoli TaxID=52584 RepID=UPI001CA545B3|nr:transketolase [Brachyspira pilosicoli]MBW5397494.1 transketolase [Brachyspira pilosicoli]
MSSIEELEKKAKKCRQTLLQMVYDSKGVAHVGGSLSAMDMAVAVYDKYINFKDSGRSRFVLSKGHVVVMQYAILANLGIIPMEELKTLKHINSHLQGHPDVNKIPETEMNTGLLGQGLAVAMGMAYARKFNNNANKIFALCGDAELHEGQIWETVQQAAHFKLDNLVAIIDNNGLSSHDPVNEVINLGSLEDKFKSFNWNVITVKDGNNMKDVVEALDKLDTLSGKPVAIIMKTVKGKGVSFLENNPNCHSLTINDKDFEQAKKDLDM